MPLEELKAILRYRNISYQEIANEIGRDKSTFSNKINGKNGSEFTASEMLGIALYLNLSKEDFIECFFSDLVA